MTWPRLFFLAEILFGWVKYYFLCCPSLPICPVPRDLFFWLAMWQFEFYMRDFCNDFCLVWMHWGVFVVFKHTWCTQIWCLDEFHLLNIHKILLPPYFVYFLLLQVLGSSCQRERENWFVVLLFLQNFMACCWCLRGWETHVFYFLGAIILIGLNLEGACCWPNVCQW